MSTTPVATAQHHTTHPEIPAGSIWVPRCSVFPVDGPWHAWTGGPFRLRDDELWRPGERGRAARRSGDGEAVVMVGEGLRWRCVFATTRTVSASEGPLCTTGCAFQIDVNCSDPRQTKLADDAEAPWRELAVGSLRGRYRAVITPGQPEYASIDIVTHDDRCAIQVDQLTNRDATQSAAVVAELVIRVIE